MVPLLPAPWRWRSFSSPCRRNVEWSVKKLTDNWCARSMAWRGFTSSEVETLSSLHVLPLLLISHEFKQKTQHELTNTFCADAFSLLLERILMRARLCFFYRTELPFTAPLITRHEEPLFYFLPAGEFVEAAEMYREVLRSSEEHKDRLKTDSLQVNELVCIRLSSFLYVAALSSRE